MGITDPRPGLNSGECEVEEFVVKVPDGERSSASGPRGEDIR